MGLFDRGGNGNRNRFFDMLIRQAARAVEAVRGVESSLDRVDDAAVQRIAGIAKVSTELRNVLIDELHKTFITPLDREDIFNLSLANISTRGEVLTGNDVMIGGFVVQGTGPQTVVVRARGPSLVPFGITNALANPTLQLVRSSDQSVLATNDDWQSAANAADITASGFAPSDSHESAILMTLQPGAYTAIVSGAGGATGVGIVEVFTTP